MSVSINFVSNSNGFYGLLRPPLNRVSIYRQLATDVGGAQHARRLSQTTMRNIKQSLFWAFILQLAWRADCFGHSLPGFGILLNAMIAAAAMSFSSVSVVGKALRLRRARW